jgi:hypothetical protein
MKIYLDLLPGDRRKKLIRKRNFRVIMEQEFLLFFPIAVFVIILANVYLLLKIQKENIALSGEQQSSQGKYQELNEYENEITRANKDVENIRRIQKEHLSWSGVFSEFEKIVPQGISVEEMSTKDYKIFVVGKAATRENLVKLKEGLEVGKCFSEANMPLSNLVSKENIEFQLDFSVSRDCLISKQ